MRIFFLVGCVGMSPPVRGNSITLTLVNCLIGKRKHMFGNAVSRRLRLSVRAKKWFHNPRRGRPARISHAGGTPALRL